MPECDDQRPGGQGGPFRWLSVEMVAIYLIAPLCLTAITGHHLDPVTWLSNYAFNFIVGLCIAGTIQLAGALLWRRLATRWPGWPGRLAAYALMLSLGVFGGGELATRVCALLWHLEPEQVRANIYRIGFTVALVVVTLLAVYDRLRARAQASEQAAQAARLAAMRAQLGALVARTNPHFLFNSLNSVAALIPEDAARAEAMLERLASLFRYALEGARRPEVTLAEEVAIARDYLEIEGIRLGERLRTSVRVAEDAGDVAVPPLCLQPLVENAIVHGVAPRRGPGRVDVSVERHGDQLEITVDDDGDGVGATGGNRSALAELRERLTLLHGDRATLTAGPRAEGGWRARVTLPIRPASVQDAAS